MWFTTRPAPRQSLHKPGPPLSPITADEENILLGLPRLSQKCRQLKLRGTPSGQAEEGYCLRISLSFELKVPDALSPNNFESAAFSRLYGYLFALRDLLRTGGLGRSRRKPAGDGGRCPDHWTRHIQPK